MITIDLSKLSPTVRDHVLYWVGVESRYELVGLERAVPDYKPGPVRDEQEAWLKAMRDFVANLHVAERRHGAIESITFDTEALPPAFVYNVGRVVPRRIGLPGPPPEEVDLTQHQAHHAVHEAFYRLPLGEQVAA